MLPPLTTVRTGLRRATEALAGELARPGGSMPAWSDLEWRLAMVAAATHGVSPLLCERSGWAAPAWRRFLASQRRHVEIRHRRIEALLQRIDADAQALGLPLVPLKGAALHALGIYVPGARPMADIDLLVRAEDLEPATALLVQLGHLRSFDHWRHRVFKPAAGAPPAVLGEHRDTPINIELHTHIGERLPIAGVDITGRIFPERFRAGLNAYPSHGALMLHLLLHAAGSLCGRTLRLMHLHDIASLARCMEPPEWNCLWQPGPCWWAWPPLHLVARYYPDAIPDLVRVKLACHCPPWLRVMTRRQTLTRVSCSELWLHAFSGLEWARSPTEAWRCIANRVRPPRDRIQERADMVRTQLWLHDQGWVTATQRRRILTWLTHRVPRMDVMFALRAAMADATEASAESIGAPATSPTE